MPVGVEATVPTKRNKRDKRVQRARRQPQQRVVGETTLRMALCREGVVRQEPSPQDVSAAVQSQSGVVWVDVQGNPNGAMQRLSEQFHIPHAIQEALLDDSARARMLESRDIFAIVVHSIDFDAQSEDAIVSKIDIVFGQNFIITLRREPAEWLDHLWASAHKDVGQENLMGRGVARLLHTILDTLVDTYFPVLDMLDDLIDQLEDATVNDTSNEVQVRLFHMKRAVATLRRVISPQVELTNSLITRTGALIPTEVEPYFADVRDHTVRVFEMLDSYRDLLSGLLDVYLTTVSNRLNVVMKQLTIIATIFMPITFITGVFGMNFGRSPQVEYDVGLNFWVVLLAMAFISGMQIWYFRKRGWL
jgi:magnesium transporter